VKQDLRRSLTVDIGDGLDRALRQRYDVSIDQSVLARLQYQDQE